MTASKEGKRHFSEQLIREWLKESKHKEGLHGEKLDRNGYAKSLLNTEDACFLCGIGGDLARHEVYGGVADRETSKAVGCWCLLCPDCHYKVHHWASWARTLHEEAQVIYESDYSHEEFMKLFGKNYLG